MQPHHDSHVITDLRAGWMRFSDLEIGEKIPGFKSSAVFFASLRANILLADTSLTPISSSQQSLALQARHADKQPRQAQESNHPPPSSLLPTSKHNEIHPCSELHLTALSDTSIDTTSSTSSTSAAQPLAVSISPRKTRPTTPHSPSYSQLRWLPASDNSPTKHRALALLASTVSEQRHMAYRSLLTHPLNILLWICLLFLTRKTLCFFHPVSCQNLSVTEPKAAAAVPFPTRHIRSSNASPICGIHGHVHQHKQHPYSGNVAYDVHRAIKWFPLHIVCAWLALTLVLMLAARFASWTYRASAREITSVSTANHADTAWLGPDDEIVVATRPNSPNTLSDPVSIADEDMIGLAIFTWVPGSNRCATRRKKVGKAFIRAWAVRADHRGQGIGNALLREIGKVCIKERSAEGVWFSKDTAHAHRPLHSTYNKPFDRRDLHARQELAAIVDEFTHRPGLHAYAHARTNSSGMIRKR